MLSSGLSMSTSYSDIGMRRAWGHCMYRKAYAKVLSVNNTICHSFYELQHGPRNVL